MITRITSQNQELLSKNEQITFLKLKTNQKDFELKEASEKFKQTVIEKVRFSSSFKLLELNFKVF